MTLHPDAAYRALQTHDARFDGRLFVGVTSTHIYCRPVCRVRTPKRENCRFFGHAAAAEAQGFRPCLRCRPELAPGLSLVDSSGTLAAHAATLLDRAAHAGDDAPGPVLAALAARLGVTDRHLRRIFALAHGVAPIDYLTTRRLLLAKQLLTDTAMPVTQVALAAGFGSLRRFNAVFVERYRLSPSALRRAGANRANAASTDGATLRLAWRPPYDIEGLLGFFARRAIDGVEAIEGLMLRRTLAIEHQGQRLEGWLLARFIPERCEVHLSVAPSLVPALGSLLARTRQALDLDADPASIDPVLAGIGTAPRHGVRLPSGWDGFEIGARVILGQQVTLAAARTLTRRLVERFGQPIETPFADLNRLFPSAQAIASAAPEDIGTLGIVRQRVKAMQALATEVAAGRLQLHRAAPLQATLDALLALPGIGHWSAQLIAMRALAWPDAWPATDIGVLNAMLPLIGTRDAKLATAHAEAWRPWRAYAVMHLWLSPDEERSTADRSSPGEAAGDANAGRGTTLEIK